MTTRWFFGDGKPRELAYAGKVLDTMKKTSAIVPVTWALEVANVIARAEAKSRNTKARSQWLVYFTLTCTCHLLLSSIHHIMIARVHLDDLFILNQQFQSF